MYPQVQRKCIPDNVISVCTYKYNVNIPDNVVSVCTYKYNVNVYLTMLLVCVPTSTT